MYEYRERQVKQIKIYLNLFQIPVAKHTGMWHNERRVL